MTEPSWHWEDGSPLLHASSLCPPLAGPSLEGCRRLYDCLGTVTETVTEEMGRKKRTQKPLKDSGEPPGTRTQGPRLKRAIRDDSDRVRWSAIMYVVLLKL